MSGRVLINISAMTMVGAALLSSTVSVRAVDITFLCAGVLRTTAEELLPEFQKSTGHNVKVIYTSIGFITQRVHNGEAADLAIVSPQQWEDLKSVGKIDPNARVVIARVGAPY
jgi:molybdate transport system substrate-binding protein